MPCPVLRQMSTENCMEYSLLSQKLQTGEAYPTQKERDFNEALLLSHTGHLMQGFGSLHNRGAAM